MSPRRRVRVTYCPECDHTLAPMWAFCPVCGSEALSGIRPAPTAAEQRARDELLESFEDELGDLARAQGAKLRRETDDDDDEPDDDF